MATHCGCQRKKWMGRPLDGISVSRGARPRAVTPLGDDSIAAGEAHRAKGAEAQPSAGHLQKLADFAPPWWEFSPARPRGARSGAAQSISNFSAISIVLRTFENSGAKEEITRTNSSISSALPRSGA